MKTGKKALLFALCLLPVAALGGRFATEMLLPSLDPSMVSEIAEKLGSLTALKAVGAVQSALYALVCGFFGCILAEKLGLLRPFRLEDPPLLRVLLISAAGGAVLSLDAWTFGRLIPQVGASYASAGSFHAPTWFASVLYGGVIEEVMVRLFLMSLIALLAWKLFFKKRERVPEGVLIAANIVSALIFAAGHLPVTALLFGELTPLILLRCFLLNGAAGLLFGRFYRKYGVQYAMLAHILFHLVSRTIWLIAL